MPSIQDSAGELIHGGLRETGTVKADDRSSKLRRGVLAAAGGILLLGLAGGGGFLAFVGSIDRVERDPPSSADAIVALTGGAQRIADAIELLGRGFARRLLITGVNERTSREEIARLSPGQRQLVQCCVDLDYRARNTVGNAEETRRWVRENGFRSLIVVTSNYHMPRTMAELDHALPHTHKLPHPVVSRTVDPADWWGNLSAARLLASEYLKFVMVSLRTRLSAAPSEEPGPDRGRPGLDELARR